ncbi:MAG: hypothetical protein JNK04_23095 [Myxococcales bacterium]|nr:hypothetical protein [Myxococcales bacterium]
MGLLARIFGTDKSTPPLRPAGPAQANATDEKALERYRYMLETAPPEQIEAAHAEAFAKLSASQRRQVLDGIIRATPPREREAAAAISSDDHEALGRLATRAEMRRPGFMERTFGGAGGLGSSLLGSFAMSFVGTMVAQSFFASTGWGQGDAPAQDAVTPEGDDAIADGDAGLGFEDV